MLSSITPARRPARRAHTRAAAARPNMQPHGGAAAVRWRGRDLTRPEGFGPTWVQLWRQVSAHMTRGEPQYAVSGQLCAHMTPARLSLKGRRSRARVVREQSLEAQTRPARGSVPGAKPRGGRKFPLWRAPPRRCGPATRGGTHRLLARLPGAVLAPRRRHTCAAVARARAAATQLHTARRRRTRAAHGGHDAQGAPSRDARPCGHTANRWAGLGACAWAAGVLPPRSRRAAGASPREG